MMSVKNHHMIAMVLVEIVLKRRLRNEFCGEFKPW